MRIVGTDRPDQPFIRERGSGLRHPLGPGRSPAGRGGRPSAIRAAARPRSGITEPRLERGSSRSRRRPVDQATYTSSTSRSPEDPADVRDAARRIASSGCEAADRECLFVEHLTDLLFDEDHVGGVDRGDEDVNMIARNLRHTLGHAEGRHRDVATSAQLRTSPPGPPPSPPGGDPRSSERQAGRGRTRTAFYSPSIRRARAARDSRDVFEDESACALPKVVRSHRSAFPNVSARIGGDRRR